MRRATSVALAAAALLAAAAAPAHATLSLPLGHAGRWLTDATGRVAILHGLNMVYKRPPYAPDATGFGDDDAAFLAAEGYDTVRVGVIYKAVEPQPGVYDDAYLDRIAQTVDTLGRHGIVSLVDFHQDLYNERFQGEGWPDWAVLDDGLPNQPQLGFPGNYLAMPALQHTFDNFWADKAGPGGVGLQERYAAAWGHVAARFRDDPNVLGYDLLNEPWPGTAWQQCANPSGCPVFDATMTQFIRRVIPEIRMSDPTHLAFYEPNVIFNDGADTNVGDVGDAKAAMSFHDYCLSADSTPAGYGQDCRQLDDLVFQHAVAHADKYRDGILLTEFGATDDLTLLRAMVQRADRFMVGWQEWHYCGCDDPTTSGPGDVQAVVLDPSKPPTGSNLVVKKLDVLSRPHPEAIAGTPESFGYDDAAHRFTLRYRTARADGAGAFGPDVDTEILLPARQYPSGYAVQVQGGTIRSAAGEEDLRVAACAGAKEVAVTVVPKGATSTTCAPPPPVRTASARPRLRVALAPRRVRRGRRVAIHVRVTASGRPVRRASVRLAGVHVFTDRRGRATVRHRFRRTGRVLAIARRRGDRAGRATLHVR